MILEQFIKDIEIHYKKNAPFVVYKKPDHNELKVLLQSDSELYTTTNYDESGFVFAPFDSKKASILIPLDYSVQHKIDFQPLEIETNNTTDGSENECQKKPHIELVAKGIDTINNGDLKKVVLSRCESINLSIEDPFSRFLKLASLYPTAFVYCWFHPKIGLWLGATPETLIQLEGQRFKTMSLAGTQSYSDSGSVAWTPKEIEEQSLVTEYIESQLQDLTNQLNVEDAKTIQAGPLLHLKSDITGLLAADLKTVIDKLHPTPAICGLPVAQAKQFIDVNESYDRSFYSGFLGELNFETKKTRNRNRRNVENNAYNSTLKTSHLFVNLRCMEVFGSQVKIYVGGGITSDSIPENEWLETVNKAKVMKEVLRDI